MKAAFHLMKKAVTKPEPLPADIASAWLQPFLDHLKKERRYSEYTARNYGQAFADFFAWLRRNHRGEGGFDVLTSRDVRDFIIEGQRRFDRRTLHNHVSGLRSFYRYWMQRGRLERNPFAEAPLPKLQKGLPKFLTESQVATLLDGPLQLLKNKSIEAREAWRDRLVLELLYGGGLRVSELVALNYGTVDFGDGSARVVGKGRKERICPLGATAMAVLKKYRDDFAPKAGPSDPVSSTVVSCRSCDAGSDLSPAGSPCAKTRRNSAGWASAKRTYARPVSTNPSAPPPTASYAARWAWPSIASPSSARAASNASLPGKW